MNPTTLRIQFPAAPTPAFRAAGARASNAFHPTTPAARSRTIASPSLELAHACRKVTAQVERTETLCLLAITAGTAIVLAGAAAQIGQGLADWPVFERFVRFVLA